MCCPTRPWGEGTTLGQNQISAGLKCSQGSLCACVSASNAEPQASCSTCASWGRCRLPCEGSSTQDSSRFRAASGALDLQSTAHPYSSFSACARKGRPELPSGSASMWDSSRPQAARQHCRERGFRKSTGCAISRASKSVTPARERAANVPPLAGPLLVGGSAASNSSCATGVSCVSWYASKTLCNLLVQSLCPWQHCRPLQGGEPSASSSSSRCAA